MNNLFPGMATGMATEVTSDGTRRGTAVMDAPRHRGDRVRSLSTSSKLEDVCQDG